MKNSLDINKPIHETRVAVAMSGGVDSSVVAAMLSREGYQVIGITLQLYDNGETSSRPGTCCAGQDIDDARQVCERLGIPHFVLNYEKRFYENVISPFIEEYRRGETPVPCIACNQTVKFKDLLEASKKLGADVLATGHYLKNIEISEDGKRALFRPRDAARDQSYFLFATTQEQVNYLRFPLGDLTKPRVRELATEFGLKIANKQDSQDICFIANGKYSDLIEKKDNNCGRSGDIIHLDGTVLGRHNGIYNYTIGQRRGLKIAYSEPLYVVLINAPKNQVIVGSKEALLTKELTLRDVNWLGDFDITSAKEGYQLFAKVRSTRPACPATLYLKDGNYIINFAQGEESVAPGQACVLFDSDGNEARLLGGGFINSARKIDWVEAAIKNIIDE